MYILFAKLPLSAILYFIVIVLKDSNFHVNYTKISLSILITQAQYNTFFLLTLYLKGMASKYKREIEFHMPFMYIKTFTNGQIKIYRDR